MVHSLINKLKSNYYSFFDFLFNCSHIYGDIFDRHYTCLWFFMHHRSRWKLVRDLRFYNYYMNWKDEFSWYFNNFSLATSWGNERTIVVCGLCHYFFVYNTHRKQKLLVCKLKTVWQLTKWFELTSFRMAVVPVINFISKNLVTWNKISQIPIFYSPDIMGYRSYYGFVPETHWDFYLYNFTITLQLIEL